MNEPTLRFTPYAWAKLIYLRDYGPTEVGGFGVSHERDITLIEDVRLVEQECTAAHVEFEGESMLDLAEEMRASGVPTERFYRVWIHTHPGSSATPSGTDWNTFAEIYGKAPWAVMFILARGGQTTTHLRFGGGCTSIKTMVDMDADFPASDKEAWAAEYAKFVTERKRVAIVSPPTDSKKNSTVDTPRRYVKESADGSEHWWDDPKWDEYDGSRYWEQGSGVEPGEADDVIDDEDDWELLTCLDCNHDWPDTDIETYACPNCGGISTEYVSNIVEEGKRISDADN